jgi:hypothetical protein
VDMPKLGTIRPFLGAGHGVARNSMGAMTYTFQDLGANASTTTPGGTSSDLAYLLTAGISLPLGRFTNPWGDAQPALRVLRLNRTNDCEAPPKPSRDRTVVFAVRNPRGFEIRVPHAKPMVLSVTSK